MEMDVLFKNTHTRTKDVVKEMFGYWYFRRKIAIVLIVLLGIAFLLSIVPVFFFGIL